MAQLKIIREIIDERVKSTQPGEFIPSDGHSGAEREVHGPKGAGLQDLAPKIGVHNEGFQAHGEIGRPRKSVEATCERGLFRFEKRGHAREEIFRNSHVGIADDDEVVLNERLELRKRRHFGISAEVFRAYDDLLGYHLQSGIIG